MFHFAISASAIAGVSHTAFGSIARHATVHDAIAFSDCAYVNVFGALGLDEAGADAFLAAAKFFVTSDWSFAFSAVALAAAAS